MENEINGAAIPSYQKKNFETMQQAVKAGQVAIMRCTDAKTGEYVTVVCIVNEDEDSYEFLPVAKMFEGNPYDEVLPPSSKEELQ